MPCWLFREWKVSELYQWLSMDFDQGRLRVRRRNPRKDEMGTRDDAVRKIDHRRRRIIISLKASAVIPTRILSNVRHLPEKSRDPSTERQ